VLSAGSTAIYERYNKDDDMKPLTPNYLASHSAIQGSDATSWLARTWYGWRNLCRRALRTISEK